MIALPGRTPYQGVLQILAFNRHKYLAGLAGTLAATIAWPLLPPLDRRALLLGTVFHIAAPDIRETLYRGFLDSTNRSQVLAYIVIGGLLATAVFSVSVVAIPLIIDRHASAAQAMRASVNAVVHNIPAMIVWSGLILVLTIVGYAPLLLGLLIIAPLLGHATWHAYKGMIR